MREGDPAASDATLGPVQEPASMPRNEKPSQQQEGGSASTGRRLGITWRNLTVEARTADTSVHENIISQFNIPKLIQTSRHKPELRAILDNSNGCVKPGEMLLVLGRPGSGCTTLLNILSNHRRGYESVRGDVHYGSMTAKEAEQYRGQIVMNTEEEIFFPSLTVGQTMDFATKMKSPATLPEGYTSTEQLRTETRDMLLESQGISHTVDTKVGNEFVRGVSGGERKRVSIVETLATRASVFCWDNSTRGLDASTALEYTKVIRRLTDEHGVASIVTLYQAGNEIYNQFDKVLVLSEGKQIFYGPRETARPFMEELGFLCRRGANIGDFLTGITVPTERKIHPDAENTFPRNTEQVRARYEESPTYQRMLGEYDFPSSKQAEHDTNRFQEAVSAERHKSLSASSTLTVSLYSQVLAAISRQYQIVWGDKASLILTQVSTLVQALIAGSLFYNAPNNSAGLFVKGGALFFSLLFNSLLSMSEVTSSFVGRPVLVKHKSFAFYHPAAFCIAQIAADIPVILLQVSVFSVVLYFMAGLESSASAFFSYWIILVAMTMCMTALFRAVGAASSTFDGASKVSGFLIMATVMYTGYMIPKPQMHPWFGWIFWIDPIAYGFDALMSNEFSGKILPCVGNNLIPQGPSYIDSAYQSCAGVPGAIQGDISLTGEQYLSALSYNKSHIWRNFGIIWAWWFLFVVITIAATTRWHSSSDAGPSLVIPREKVKVSRAIRNDAEAQVPRETIPVKDQSPDTDYSSDNSAGLIKNTSIFTWKNVTYTVKTKDGDRVLLDNVQGWVKPGMLGALMGSSGAGKTTLLDVLAQRKTEGHISGSIMVDGRELPISFQRSAGYCEQLDVHEAYATVREALEFSALLRQSRDTPREEKLKYVDTIIDLLELHDLADTLIGTVGNGLTVEQRKRVTIGVELVSKPSILIFLDEPTSGLDGQSAYNTVRFLRKLADAGQAVLVTIHQPSAQLFAEFDTLLLLAKGGKTVYFGDIGEDAATIRDYFGRNGAPCPDHANPAEHMIDVVSGHLSQGHDWNRIWLDSAEHAAAEKTLDSMIADAASKPPVTMDDGHEFALPLWDQIKIVTSRMNLALFRNRDYVNNKMVLHISSALFNGFSFWMVGDSVQDLQLRLFTVFNFIFVAPGVLAQLQPLFIERRDIFETREKKSKMYSWVTFVTALIVSEIPYLCICATLYFVCWYYTVGFPSASARAGATFFVMLAYEFVYTGIGQFIAAYAPNAVFAALANPVFLGTLISFCGVLVPYAQLQVFWKYWMYWLDPFNYLMGAMLTFTVWGTDVACSNREFALFDPPANSTCGEYLMDYMQTIGASSHLDNPDATAGCRVCTYSNGSDYLRTLNIKEYYYGWRDAAICVIFALSSYALVYLLMKLRTKTSKKAA